tara:strand:- start:133 stop:537 length:405 start_codon:yes stop_codon:yes gene_type:complete
MGLVIEISIDINKYSKIISIKEMLSSLAENYNCLSEYYLHECEGTKSFIKKNDTVQIVEFNIPKSIEDKEYILQYINNILKLKIVKLETIYIEDGKVDIIYNCIKNSYTNMGGDYKTIKNKPVISIISEYLNKI